MEQFLPTTLASGAPHGGARGETSYSDVQGMGRVEEHRHPGEDGGGTEVGVGIDDLEYGLASQGRCGPVAAMAGMRSLGACGAFFSEGQYGGRGQAVRASPSFILFEVEYEHNLKLAFIMYMEFHLLGYTLYTPAVYGGGKPPMSASLGQDHAILWTCAKRWLLPYLLVAPY